MKYHDEIKLFFELKIIKPREHDEQRKKTRKHKEKETDRERKKVK